eukprot:GHVT01026835.1.p1 GENE.GHVT01026835.1~~GHVT01026835.1.p1  ORF type:complete len:102 (-),score=3.50 GHVT01026835.1:423-728(-)
MVQKISCDLVVRFRFRKLPGGSLLCATCPALCEILGELWRSTSEGILWLTSRLERRPIASNPVVAFRVMLLIHHLIRRVSTELTLDNNPLAFHCHAADTNY